MSDMVLFGGVVAALALLLGFRLSASSFAAWLAFTEVFRPPRFVRALRRWRGKARLRKELRAKETGPSAVVHWDRYRHLSKSELFAVAGEFGWHYSEQRIVPEGWALDFVR